MSPLLFIGGYWSQRQENRSECAARLVRFLESIGKEHVLLSQWYKLGRSRKQAKASRIDVSLPALEVLLCTNNRDVDKVPIPELGFSFSAWNGNFDESASVGITCGGYSQYIGNAVVLELPRTILEESAQLSETLQRILVDAWNPEKTIVEQLDGTKLETVWRDSGR
jgi:hypothetical protein